MAIIFIFSNFFFHFHCEAIHYSLSFWQDSFSGRISCREIPKLLAENEIWPRFQIYSFSRHLFGFLQRKSRQLFGRNLKCCKYFTLRRYYSTSTISLGLPISLDLMTTARIACRAVVAAIS